MSNSTAVVCDLDGVILRGNAAIAGAGAALDALMAAGHEIVFATNNSTRTPLDVATRIRDLARFAAEPEQVVTSAQATAHHLRERVESVFIIGEDGLAAALREAGIEVVADAGGADAVVVGLDRAVTYDKLAAATLAVRAGALLVASNTDATFPTAAGLVPGAGTFVAALERSTGVTAVPCGKPHDPMADLVAARVGSDSVIMVGDRIETDIEFGRRHGWTTVLVLTGVTSREQSVGCAADHVLDSVADLPGVVDAQPRRKVDRG